MKVTILGSGSSAGVPQVGRGWGRCDPENPKNRRLRPSILLDWGDRRILIDTSPDLRQQLLAADVQHLDAVIYTHAHADHLHGLDDLRALNRAMNAPLDIYCDDQTLGVIEKRFGYALEPLRADAKIYYKPVLIPHRIAAGEAFELAGRRIRAFDQDHGYSRTLGFRFGGFGYSTDLTEMTDDGFAVVDGVHTWIIGVFSDRPHETHAHVDKALAWIERVRPKRAILTHLSLDLDHAALSERLPDGVEAAFDGMSIEIPD